MKFQKTKDEPLKLDSGAPAALKAIEADELLCRRHRDAAFKIWQEADEKNVLGDTIKEADERRAWGRYLEAREVYAEAAKQLALFDKGVREDRREGEKILVSDVKELFAQIDLSWSLALESYIVTNAQSAALCESPEQFHAAHAENMRAAKAGALDAAKREGILPSWIL
jgi:hypothetical protein